MESNRLRFVEIDESFGVSQSSAITGFSVVKAPKGTSKPVFFPKGSTRKILAMIGAPHRDYPGIQEIIDYNNNYSIWVSAPAGTKAGLYNYYGGVYITTEGSIESFYQVTDPESPSFNIEVTAKNATSPYSEGTTISFTAATIQVVGIQKKYFSDTTIGDITVSYTKEAGGTASIILHVSGSNVYLEDDVTIVGDLVDNADPLLSDLRFTGTATVPEFDFTDVLITDYLSATPTAISVKWMRNIEEEVIQTVYQLSPRSEQTTLIFKDFDLATEVSGVTNPYYNTFKFSISENIYGSEFYNSNYITVSPDYNKVDSAGNTLYFDDIMDGNYYVSGKVYKQLTDTSVGVTWPTTVTKVLSGTRIIEDSTFSNSDIPATIQAGWDLCSGPEYEDVKMFIDVENLAEIKTKMASMRAGAFKFSTFISGIKVASTDTATAVGQIVTARSSAPNVTGLAYYCNEFLVKENYTGTEYWTIPLGAMASMLSLIMEKKNGGFAPMFTNENGLGGQINKTVKRQKYNFSADNLDTLDGAGVNPIIWDSFYGVMATSHKTAQTPIILSDWSYLGHQMAFDLFRDEIRKNVMIPQIGKPIDSFHMAMRREQAQVVLNKRLTGDTAIWNSGRIYVEEVNTNETKLANKFVIKIRVKVNPYSEYVELIFTNIAQTSEV